MKTQEALKFYQNEIEKCLNFYELLTQASVMIRGRAKALSDGCLEAAEQFRREAEDNKYLLEELKIEIEKIKEVK